MSSVVEPFRALGRVGAAAPFVVQTKGRTESFVTTSVGRAFHIYSASKLRLLFVSPMTAKKITALAAWREYTFTASGNDIAMWHRARLLKVLSKHTAPVTSMLMFGDHLISVSAKEGTVHVWDPRTGDIIRSLEFDEDWVATCVMHPDTYLNKVVFGFANGGMRLYNLQSGEMVYEFGDVGRVARKAEMHSGARSGGPGVISVSGTMSSSATVSSKPAAVTLIEGSPAIDVVGVGLDNGVVVMQNLKYDKALFTLRAKTGGAVTALAFRSDGEPILCSGSASGDVCVWNLEAQRLVGYLQHAHAEPITKLSYLPGQPVLVSSADDNTLKMWIFDGIEGDGRLLRSREGHNAPVTRLRYYGDDQYIILSAAADGSFRYSNAMQDHQSQLFSFKRVFRINNKSGRDEWKKLTTAVDFDSSPIREKEWGNLVSAHRNDPRAYVWRTTTKAVESQVLTQPDGFPCTSVALSACGNYCLVGSEGGTLDLFNVQSGRYRGALVSKGDGRVRAKLKGRGSGISDLERLMRIGENHDRVINGEDPAKKKKNKKGAAAGAQGDSEASSVVPAHDGAVTGVTIDLYNKQAISISLDGKMKFWDFDKRTLLHTLDLETPLTVLTVHKDSDLCAVVGDDLVVRVIDMETRRLIRSMRKQTNRITDVAFSPDARWITAVSMDQTMCMWDVPSGRLIDYTRFDTPAVSVAFSPKGDFLTTAHAGSTELFLWTNRAMFAAVSMKADQDTPVHLKLPTVAALAAETQALQMAQQNKNKNKQTEEEKEAAAKAKAQRAEEEALEQEAKDKAEEAATVDPLAPGLLTLSSLPKVRWQTLPNLDEIKERNKPMEPPKAPEAAPFFLTTLPGLEPTFVAPAASQDDNGDDAKNASRILNLGGQSRPRSKFQTLLDHGAATNNFSTAFAYLKSLSASGVDVELQSLETDAPHRDLDLVLDLFAQHMQTQQDYEVQHAYLHRFLQIHGDLIASRPPLRRRAEHLLERVRGSWGSLHKLIQANLCLLNFVSNLQS